ncbi:Mth938-like domain-containing protein [Pacificimonas sp. ICDLI1SI03]
MAFEEVRGPEGAPRIEAVRDNRFVVAGERRDGAFLIWPDGVEAVDIEKVDDLSFADFTLATNLQPPRDVLLIGSGAKMAWPDFEMLEHLRERGLGPEVMDSRAAARTYNLLLAEERMVAALILPPA